MKLSVIDLQWPGNMPALVPELERLGYGRYWVTEHYTPIQSASPTILAALAAGLLQTESMRTGTAGVLLNYRSPLAVASDFALLELFFPGRTDLGVAGTRSGAEPTLRALLDGRPQPDWESYADKIRELVRLVRRDPAPDGAVHGNQVGPYARTSPEIWVCGLSRRSAQLAGGLGVSYAFHDYLHQVWERDCHGESITASYVKAFQANAHAGSPQFNVACYGICAETERRARSLWSEALQAPASERAVVDPRGADSLPRPSFLGTPERCREQLLEILSRYEAQELVISSLSREFSSQLESYRLLAEAFELQATGVTPP
jgi:luciferase family oxidoreductase group 1